MAKISRNHCDEHGESAGRRVRAGVTLIELLIVICIITMLLQLLLPAVQMSREAARRTACGNNLRQLGLGVQAHEAAHGHFPSGGWGCLYVGDPDRGMGKDQPGGWVYNTLPYIEQTSLHDMGKGLSGDAKRLATQEMISHAVPPFNCPSRREAVAQSFDDLEITYVNFTPPLMAGKSDYAGNAGDLYTDEINSNGGPPSYEESDKAGDGEKEYWIEPSLMTGVFYQRSATRAQDIVDGMSNTYLLGEKYVHPEPIRITNHGDDQCMYLGADEDIVRWAKHHSQGALTPMQDHLDFHTNQGYGSAHPSGCQMLFCDGSLRMVGYDIDNEVHCQQANRQDNK